MYHYNEYRCDDLELIKIVVSDYPLGLLVSNFQEEYMTSHVPLSWAETTNGSIRLVGHLDNNNTQIARLEGANVLVIFSGPDSYISPHDYVTRQLPTWNYMRVHAIGKARISRPGTKILGDINNLIEHSEDRLDPWIMNPNDTTVRKLSKKISRIEIVVSKIEGRFKLSQEKSKEDRRAALSRLLKHRSKQQTENIEKLAFANIKRKTPLKEKCS